MVRYGVMRHDCRRTDHNDLMCILFVYFRSGNMKMILQLGNNVSHADRRRSAFNVFYFIFLQIIKQCVIVDYALFQEQYD